MGTLEAGDGPVHIDSVAGDATIIIGKPPPEIPMEQARECPQCGQRAWRKTRHCWSCGFDFDRRAAKRSGVLRALGFSLILLALLACLVCHNLSAWSGR